MSQFIIHNSPSEADIYETVELSFSNSLIIHNSSPPVNTCIAHHMDAFVQIFKDFHLVFHWVSKRIHVMRYTGNYSLASLEKLLTT